MRETINYVAFAMWKSWRNMALSESTVCWCNLSWIHNVIIIVFVRQASLISFNPPIMRGINSRNVLWGFPKQLIKHHVPFGTSHTSVSHHEARICHLCCYAPLVLSGRGPRPIWQTPFTTCQWMRTGLCWWLRQEFFCSCGSEEWRRSS